MRSEVLNPRASMAASSFHPYSKGYVLRAGDRQSPVGSRVTIFLRLRVSRRLHLLGLTPTPCDSRVLFADTRNWLDGEMGQIEK